MLKLKIDQQRVTVNWIKCTNCKYTKLQMFLKFPTWAMWPVKYASKCYFWGWDLCWGTTNSFIVAQICVKVALTQKTDTYMHTYIHTYNIHI